MQCPSVFALVAAAFLACAAGQADVNPVQKVVNLLEEMKAQISKENDEDQEAFTKMGCWCETNEKGKTEAVAAATARIEELEAFIEEAAGQMGQLKTEIAALEESVAADQESLAKATGIKEKETAEFEAEAKDMSDTIATLAQAVDVLSKVQLMQKQGRPAAEVQPLLVQLRNAVQSTPRLGQFTNVMQRDLWDVMSSIDTAGGKSASFLRQNSQLSKTSLDEPTGAAAGAKSYNSASGSIFGMLAEMKEDFERKLAAANKEEASAMALFQQLRTSKMAEIASGQKQLKSKEKVLADTAAKSAQAKDDLESTKEALSADQAFLVQVVQSCKVSNEEFEGRVKARNEELQALAETIKILTTDDARDLFLKNTFFLQVGSVGSNQAVSSTDAARNAALNRAMKHILHIARKNKNWVLASLAVTMRLDSGLDAFEKVKKAMDKMLNELKAQQKAEVEKKDFCNNQLDEAEDSIKVKTNDKEDLEGKKLMLGNAIKTLENDLETVNGEIETNKVSLKQAGEDRKGENVVFQQSVSDQRATINILQKALSRLEAFYAKKASLVQAPGQGIGEKPPAAQEYSKSGGGGGVIQLIQKIISEASAAEATLLADEQDAQKSYMNLVQDLNGSIEADENAVVEKTKLLEQAKADLSETEGGILINGEELDKLTGILTGIHTDCDFLTKYFSLRQKARGEEMAAIVEAKAILSGANFGTALEEGDDAEQA